VVVIRVSPQEKRRLEELAEREGLPLGTWVRQKCLPDEPKDKGATK
jgi:hypothetical protein